jgi:predicted nucleic acid-binding protein
MTKMDADAIFVDTNILIYSNLAHSLLHQAATNRLVTLDEEGTELWLSRQVLREYLAAMSRPGNLTAAMPISDLVRDVRYFENRFRVAEDGAFVTAKLLDLLLQFPSGGRQVHDANIVATMLVHGVAKLLTHNTKDFARFASVIEVLPLHDES